MFNQLKDLQIVQKLKYDFSVGNSFHTMQTYSFEFIFEKLGFEFSLWYVLWD